MNRKDRQIQLFLEIFYLMAGIYVFGFNIWKLSTGFWVNGVFEFYNGEIPVFNLSAGLLIGFLCILSSWFLWLRSTFALGFTLFVSGLLFSLSVIGLGKIISTEPYHAIPLVIILIVILQSVPFLIRKSSRGL